MEDLIYEIQFSLVRIILSDKIHELIRDKIKEKIENEKTEINK